MRRRSLNKLLNKLLLLLLLLLLMPPFHSISILFQLASHFIAAVASCHHKIELDSEDGDESSGEA